MGRPRKPVEDEKLSKLRKQWREASAKHYEANKELILKKAAKPAILVCLGSPSNKNNRRYRLRGNKTLHISRDGKLWFPVTDLRDTIDRVIEIQKHVDEDNLVPEPLARLVEPEVNEE